ncbi:hypothetical protein DFQ26_000822 [Actinomortierella ambigua]|nr:hypothetical protein DFQ26_000822 [Actinomortierella ambigua]
MMQHQKSLEKVGISSIILDSEISVDDQLVTDLADGGYRAVLITPEKLFMDIRFRDVWSRPGWQQRLMAVVLDEAHCVDHWSNFRRHYSQLGVLRAKVPAPFIAFSATIPISTKTKLVEALHFRPGFQFYNEGNDRRNAYLEVRRHRTGRTEKLEHGLEFILDGEKTMVYVDSKSRGYDILTFLHSVKPGFPARTYHRNFRDEYKTLTLEKFISGEIRVLICTDAAGMGLDIRDVKRVVQFGCVDTTTMSTLVQRLGRVASSDIHETR